jgi:methylenetetrahydrofolate dehydrogenase (NAD+)
MVVVVFIERTKFFKQSNIVVTGVPTKSYRLPTEWIQPNTTVVNVASFKNVDEEKLLEIPGVVYVPMVGKVTVAMLERNLMRLYENFHSENSKNKLTKGAAVATVLSQQQQSLWRLQIFTATVVTVLLALQLVRK